MLRRYGYAFPKAVFSLFPSRTVGKHSSFNGFLELTHHVAKVKKLGPQKLCFH